MNTHMLIDLVCPMCAKQCRNDETTAKSKIDKATNPGTKSISIMEEICKKVTKCAKTRKKLTGEGSKHQIVDTILAMDGEPQSREVGRALTKPYIS